MTPLLNDKINRSIFKLILSIRIAPYLCISIFSLLIQTSLAQEIGLNWLPREDLNILLPQSVRIFEANGQLTDGKPFRAMYARVDLSDKNLSIRSIGSNTIRETTFDTYSRGNGILAINGGYFASEKSVSLIVQDGEVIAPGPEVIPRGAFGLVKGVPEIVWSAAKNPNQVLQFSSPGNSKESKIWNPAQAVGGGPVLIKNGKINLSSKAEKFSGSHTLRHPRTAIGYKDDNTLILMVVDGRQNASVGVTLEELADIMYQTGAHEAVNLDGGGSSAMVAANEIVNIPVDVTGGNRNSLRKNAGGLVISRKTTLRNSAVHIIDTEDSLYHETGIWRNSNHSNFYGKTPSRLCKPNKYNKAYYLLQNIPKKEYQLAVWNSVQPDNKNHNRVQYIIHYNKTTDTVSLNQFNRQNFGKWNVLGNYFLTSADSIEVLCTEGSLLSTDAIRLIATQNTPELPERGNLRIAVISDLNSGLGSIDYEWQVDSIIQRIPKLWKPDLVVCGGDMVAGMGISDTVHLRKMWKAFNDHITKPLQKAKIPFAFTIGNHDGNKSHPTERNFTSDFWKNNINQTKLKFIDKVNFPHYYSFLTDSIFFASWDASSSKISEENIKWFKDQLEKPEAQNAKYRFVLGHMPLYGVAKERDSKGNVLENPDLLRQLMEKYNVHTYISGHQHAYYPAKRGKLELLNTGAIGSGARTLLGEHTKPTNTITIIDIFYDPEKITYTTYDIKEKNADQMKIIDHGLLPSSIFGSTGYTLRRDMNTASNTASGTISHLNTIVHTPLKGTGEVSASIINNKLILKGWFSIDKNSGIFTKQDDIQLYLGKNATKGNPLTSLKITKRRANKISFEGTVNLAYNYNELLAVGALHIEVSTHKGTLRTQLYPPENSPPSKTQIISHQAKNIYGIRKIEALYTIEWKAATDHDADYVSYVYQIARDSLFSKIIHENHTGRNTKLKIKESELYKFLNDLPYGVPRTFYHRVISTDGSHLTMAPATELKLQKTDEIITGPIETEAPAYTLKKKVGSSGAGYGAVWDKENKLWLADYHKGLIILDENYQQVSFSPLNKVMLNQSTYDLNPVTGISSDKDGNILAAINRQLIKIDASTGNAIALWEVPEGNRAITTPRVSENGEIYAMSLFPNDPNYILKQNHKKNNTFELVRTLNLKSRILSRTFEMTPDGSKLYFPDPGNATIQVFTSEDGINYTEGKPITTITGGCSAIQSIGEHSLYMASRTNGISPSSIHYRNDKLKQMWTLELPELNGAEPRGIGVSKDQKTLIFCSWDKERGYYLYQIDNDQ